MLMESRNVIDWQISTAVPYTLVTFSFLPYTTDRFKSDLLLVLCGNVYLDYTQNVTLFIMM